MVTHLLHRVYFIALLVIFLLPFATFRDFYPFQRMGMFAYVPPTAADSVLYYEIMANGQPLSEVQPDFILFEGDKYQYLIRNYVYRQEQQELLHKIALSLKLTAGTRLELYACVYYPNTKATKRTLIAER